MIHIKLAWHNLTHHLQQYLPFIIANSILIAINYIFITLSISTLSMATACARLGLTFILTITIIFMFYINCFLLKQRSQELGLYSVLGLTKRDLHLIVGIENCLISLTSIVSGIIIGIIFEKLAFLMIKRLIKTPMLATTFNSSAIIITTLIFIGTFSLLFIYDILKLQHINCLNLWRNKHVNEKVYRNHWLLSIIGIVVLIIGYHLSLTTKPNIMFLPTFALAILLVIIGTYLTFITGIAAFLHILQKNKHFYYQPHHFISTANMLYRIKQNGASLATICLLCTAVLVAMIASVSFFKEENNLLKQWNPYDIMLTTTKPLTTNEVTKISQNAHANQITLGKLHTIQHTLPTYGTLNDNRFSSNNINEATYQVISLTLTDYNRLQHTNYHLNSNEVLLYLPAKLYNYSKLVINHHYYYVHQIKHFNLAYNYGHSIMQPLFIIAKNKQICEQINHKPWVNIYGFNIYGSQKHQLVFSNQLQRYLQLDNAMISSRSEMQIIFINTFGSLIFIGIFITLSMIIITALMIYYKQLSEGYADRLRFHTMRQVGLDHQETQRIIHSQVLLVFMLTIIGAIINLAFAMPAIKKTMMLLSMYNSDILFTTSIITLIAFIIGYLILYSLTAKEYQHIINQSPHYRE